MEGDSKPVWRREDAQQSVAAVRAAPVQADAHLLPGRDRRGAGLQKRIDNRTLRGCKYKSIYGSIHRVTNRSVYRNINRKVYKSIYRSIYRIMNRSIYRNVNRSVYRIINRSICRSIYRIIAALG